MFQVRLVGHSLAPLYPNPLGSQGKTIQSQVVKILPSPPDHMISWISRLCRSTLTRQTMKDFPFSKMPLWNIASWALVRCSSFPPSTGTRFSVSQLFMRKMWIISGECFGHWHIHQHVLWWPWRAHFLGQAFPPSVPSIYLCFFFCDCWDDNSFCQEHFYHWFLNILEQNRGAESFSKIVSRLPEVFLMHSFKSDFKNCLTSARGFPDALIHIGLLSQTLLFFR